MKTRDYKNFSKGSIYHVFNRGNNKERIFLDEQDFKAFLFRLSLVLGFSQKELEGHPTIHLPYSGIRIAGYKKEDFKLHAFCIMPSHFHLLIEQCGDISISKVILKACTSYAIYYNKKYVRVGHVFQDQFKAVLIESDPQLLWTSSYIHMNPVKDNLVLQPGDYIWSSFSNYLGHNNLPIIYTEFLLAAFGDKENLKKQTLDGYEGHPRNVPS